MLIVYIYQHARTCYQLKTKKLSWLCKLKEKKLATKELLPGHMKVCDYFMLTDVKMFQTNESSTSRDSAWM